MTTESHDAVNELLPWYANGTLSLEERAMVDRHVATCVMCEQELQSLRTIGSALTELADDAPPASASSLARTLSAIDDWEKTRPSARSSGVTAWLSALWNPTVPQARLAFAAQFALILVLGALLLTRGGRDGSFTTLSGPDGSPSGVRLTVVFEPTTSEESMRRVLADIGGTLVSGPSAAGVYVVALPGIVEGDPAVSTAIERLRNSTGVVRFVEQQP